MEALLVLVILAIVLVPVWILVLLYGLRHRLRNLETDLHGLQRRLTPQPPPIAPPSPVAAVAKPPPAASPAARAVAPPPAPPLPPPLPILAEPAVSPQAPAAPPPPVPAGAEKEPSEVPEILRRLGRWLLVGDERGEEGGMERAIAMTWLMRAGVIALVCCAAYFLKWSIERGLIGPLARVLLSALAGAGLAFGGLRLLTNRYRALGQGFLGGGIAILYFSVYAAGPMYHLIPTPAAFALMVGVTAAAGGLALKADSMLTAILGIIGGFFTPVLLSPGAPNFLVLYSYMLLLSAGIFTLSRLRPWRLLNYLGFALTWSLAALSLAHYTTSDFSTVLPLLTLLFVLHTAIVYSHNVFAGGAFTTLETVYLLVNAAVFPVIGYDLVRDALGGRWPAAVTGGLALYYAAHLPLLRKRGDSRLLTALTGLTVLFAILTAPILFDRATLTAVWALMAATVLWIGERTGSRFLRGAGAVLYAMVFARLVVTDLTAHYLDPSWMGPDGNRWPAGLGHRLWTFGLSAGALLAAGRLTRPSGDAPPANAELRWLRRLVLGAGVAAVFLYAQFETAWALKAHVDLQRAAMTLLFGVLAAWLLGRDRRYDHPFLRMAALAFAVGALLKTALFDATAWAEYGAWPAGTAWTLRAAGGRLLDVVCACSAGVAGWRLMLRRNDRMAAGLFGYTALAAAFAYLSLESYAVCRAHLYEFRHGAVSVLWALFAAGFVAAGLARNLRRLRHTGLLLFSVVTLKVFLVDLHGMPPIHRVVAFLLVGGALLAGAAVYAKFERENAASPEDDGAGKRSSS